MEPNLSNQGLKKLERAKRSLDEKLGDLLLFARKRSETLDRFDSAGVDHNRLRRVKVYCYLKREKIILLFITHFR